MESSDKWTGFSKLSTSKYSKKRGSLASSRQDYAQKAIFSSWDWFQKEFRIRWIYAASCWNPYSPNLSYSSKYSVLWSSIWIGGLKFFWILIGPIFLISFNALNFRKQLLKMFRTSRKIHSSIFIHLSADENRFNEVWESIKFYLNSLFIKSVYFSREIDQEPWSDHRL